MKTVAVLAVGLLACAGLSARPDEKDAPKIEGTYTLVSGKKMGQPVDDESKKAKYIVTKDKITIDGKDAKFVMSYKLDAKNPKNIDMEIVEAPIKDIVGSKAEGIFEAKGEELKLAYSIEKGKRPKDFEGKDGFSFVLKKSKGK